MHLSAIQLTINTNNQKKKTQLLFSWGAEKKNPTTTIKLWMSKQNSPDDLKCTIQTIR